MKQAAMDVAADAICSCISGEVLVGYIELYMGTTLGACCWIHKSVHQFLFSLIPSSALKILNDTINK